MRVAIVLVLVLGSLRSRAEAAATPFELGDQGGVILAVSLNGHGPFRFLLDTGSTHSAVSEAVAAAIGAPPVARTVVGSAVGGRNAIVVRIDALECGALVARGLLASVAAFDMLSATDRIQGVIGQDALAAIRYTIDFRRRVVVWWPENRAVARGTSIALEDSHGRFLITLPQRRDVLRLVPDSGAASLLLFDPPKHLPLTLLSARGTLRTVRARDGPAGPDARAAGRLRAASEPRGCGGGPERLRTGTSGRIAAAPFVRQSHLRWAEPDADPRGIGAPPRPDAVLMFF